MSSNDSHTRETVELFRELLHALLMSSVPAWLDLQLTLPQLRTVFIVAHNRTSSVMQVSNALGVGEPTASHLIDKLVKAGLVERTEDPRDRRRALVRLSSTGENLIERLLGWERFLSKWLHQIPKEDLSDLQQGLKAIMDEIHAHTAIDRSEAAPL